MAALPVLANLAGFCLSALAILVAALGAPGHVGHRSLIHRFRRLHRFGKPWARRQLEAQPLRDLFRGFHSAPAAGWCRVTVPSDSATVALSLGGRNLRLNKTLWVAKE